MRGELRQSAEDTNKFVRSHDPAYEFSLQMLEYVN